MRREQPPIWHSIATPSGTIHTKAIEIGMGLNESEGHYLYLDMKDDGRFHNPTEKKIGCYGLAEAGETWAERLLEEHAAGRRPWLLS
jgi:hypothetical protein